MGHVRDSKRPKLLASDPQKVHELYEELASHDSKVRMTMSVFRESLLAYANEWMQDAAKAVAIHQDQVTVRLGRDGISSLKQRIRDHAAGLVRRVADAFSDEEFAVVPDASSGQVEPLLNRLFSAQIRRVLGTVYPILVEAGYESSAQWVDDEGEPMVRLAPSQKIDLPSDLRSLIDQIVEIHTAVKVIESKVVFYKRARGRGIAAKIWDDAPTEG